MSLAHLFLAIQTSGTPSLGVALSAQGTKAIAFRSHVVKCLGTHFEFVVFIAFLGECVSDWCHGFAGGLDGPRLALL